MLSLPAAPPSHEAWRAAGSAAEQGCRPVQPSAAGPAGSTGTGATDREGTLTAAATAPPACRLPGRVRGHTWTRRPLPGPAGRPSCCCRRWRHPPAPGAAPASPPRPYGAAAAPADELIRPGRARPATATASAAARARPAPPRPATASATARARPATATASAAARARPAGAGKRV
ncbi:transcriptional regulatory protein AlgP-like [Agelaius tricolor]|uniref:transcriptional regulatory protein AlgP-like n=1 Tax=Agelaius tricolor TaxID=9191 RepID=UPI0039F1B958